MTSFKMVLVGDKDLDCLDALAGEIWRQHFTPIIGSDQVEYMIAKFQCKEAMLRQRAEEGYRYYFIVPQEGERAGIPQGYCGFILNPKVDNGALFGGKSGELFLSKLYMRQDMRGLGGASVAFGFLKEQARAHDLPCIRLTCNKYNDDTLDVYKHWGFIVEDDDLVTDIGKGFIMDDYGMRFDL